MFYRQVPLLIAAVCLSAAVSSPAHAKVCQKPNGKYYGIADQDKCIAPAKEASRSPISFLGINVGSKQNYDTAKEQGEFKNMGRHWRDIVRASNKKENALIEKWNKVNKRYSGRFYGGKEGNFIRDAYIEDIGKLYDEFANHREWLVKAIKAARLPRSVKPITDKIIALETQVGALLRARKGLNTWLEVDVPQNPRDNKIDDEILEKLIKVNSELDYNLYPQVRVKLNLPSAAREKY